MRVISSQTELLSASKGLCPHGVSNSAGSLVPYENVWIETIFKHTNLN